MADKRFDASIKLLVEEHKAAWPGLIGARPYRAVDVIDAVISTVTGAADKALLVHGETYDWILNLEVQAGIGSMCPAGCTSPRGVFSKFS